MGTHRSINFSTWGRDPISFGQMDSVRYRWSRNANPTVLNFQRHVRKREEKFVKIEIKGRNGLKIT
jgi:hypothetical protein